MLTCSNSRRHATTTLVGRGPDRPIELSSDGLQPGPAHHMFKLLRPGPARPIRFSNVSAWPSLAQPGPAHDIGSEAHETRALRAGQLFLWAGPNIGQAGLTQFR